MQFELPLWTQIRRLRPRNLPEREDWLEVGGHKVRLRLVANRRARRYVLRLSRDGSARVTIPRGGKAGEARRFAQKNLGWLENQLQRRDAVPILPRAWTLGTEILFRGERQEVSTLVGVAAPGTGALRTGNVERGCDLRPMVEKHLRKLAVAELPGRVRELAGLHHIEVNRVSVRNQRSRWGSCSRRGTISLNWRLVQAPIFVRDYIILHELAHVKEMNHSARFWREVERLCPEFKKAEKWLKGNGELLR